MKKLLSLFIMSFLAVSAKAAQYNFTPDAQTTQANISASGVAIGKGKTAASEQLDVTGNVNVNGRLIEAKTAVTGISTTTTIPFTTSYETLASTGGTVTVTATPSIATSGVKSGSRLTLSATSAAGPVVLQDDGTLSGSKLQLGSSTRTITQYKTLSLIYDATDGFWREVSFGDN